MLTEGTIIFEWDDAKATTNARKHDVSFEEAMTAFYDPYALLLDDEEHSVMESRYILFGMSLKARALVVCHCYKETDERIRIISARKMTKNEAKQYWRRRHEG